MNLEPKKDGVNNIFPDLNAAVNNKPDTSKSINAGSATPPNFMPKEDRFYDPANLANPISVADNDFMAGDDSTITPLPEISMANIFSNAPIVTKKKISKKSLTIIAVIFLLLAAATGIIIVKGEELGILRPKPEKVLAQMMQNMENVKTAHSEGNGQLVVTNSAISGQSLNMGFKLAVDEDSTDEENLKINLNYDLNLALEGMSFTANFDMIAAEKIAYFRLNKAPLLPFIDLGKFKGKWIKIDPKEIEKLNPSFAESFNSLDKSKEMNDKMMEIMKKYQNNLVKVKNELPDEKVNNISAYSYALTVNKDTMRQFFKEVMDLSQELNQTKLPSSVTNIEDYKKIQEKLSGMIIDFAADKAETKILIGKKDKMLYGISFKIDINGKEIGEIVANVSKELPSASASAKLPKEMEGLIASLVFDIRYSNFNEPVNIKAPENAEDFMKALGIEDSFGAAKKKAHDARRTVDLQSLRAPLMLYQDDNNGIYPISKGIEKTNDKNSAIYKLVPKYILSIPVDPLDPNYYYGYKSDGKTYELTARAEDMTSISGKCNKVNDNICLITVKSE